MVIVVSGFMGSGKTTISSLLKDNNNSETNIVNTDQLISKLYINNKDLISKVNNILNVNSGVVDKEIIKEKIEEDFSLLFEIEAAVVEVLNEELATIIAENKKKDIITIVEIFTSNKLTISFDYEIIAFASKETILERLTKRGKMTTQVINNILNKQQLEMNKPIKQRTFVINTEVDISEQLGKVEEYIYDKNRKNS